MLDEESSYLTTFNRPFGRFRFTRLPFGLCISQDIFQQQMDFILDKCPGTAVIADYIAVHSLTEEEYDANLRNLVQNHKEMISWRRYIRLTKVLRSASYKQKPVYFGLILTRTLKLKCRSVKFVKKAKTHKPTKQWNHMKFLLHHTWQVVGTDLFTWNGDEYLLMWDYYSKFPSSDLENTKWADHWRNSCKA